jgi:hypothetical protein
MAIVRTEGFLFKKTVVEHDDGSISKFSGSAKVTQVGNSICVKEEGVFSSESVCFVSRDKDSSQKAGLPDGTLVGSSKSIDIRKADGSTEKFASSVFAVHGLEKNGDQVHVTENGLFGKRIVKTIPADQISSIASSDCNVCRDLNPLYK